MTRMSYKKVKECCDVMGWNLIRHENLGNRKNPYYTYSITNKDKICLAYDLPLGIVYAVAMGKYKGEI